MPLPTLTPIPAEPQPSATPATLAPAKDVYSLGDTARLDPFTVMVRLAEPSADPGAPQAGQRFVLLDVSLHNTGVADQDVALLTQLFLEDAAGSTYTVVPGASLSAVMSLNGEIQAGEQASGVVGYLVPEDAGCLRLIFRTTATAGESGRIVFDLQQ